MKGYGSLDQGDSSGNGKKVKSKMDGLETKRKKGGMGLGRERKREREKNIISALALGKKKVAFP